MTCPLNRTMSICQDVNGYFWGIKEEGRPCCRCSEYCTTAASVLMANMLSEPVGMGCDKAGICSEMEVSECQNGPNLPGPASA